MYAIIGLGNPGREYENTRHNMGFKALDVLAQKTETKIEKIKFRSLVGEAMIAGQKVILVKPQTFMNNSGIAVREVMEYYKIEEENLLVIYDDADLEEGTIRIRPFGSSGSHNGMKSVIYHLYSDRFPRIRIGIGKPVYDMINFVTGGIPKEKMEEFSEAWEKAADAAICFVESGIVAAMNKYNPSKKKKEEKPVEES
ncbi:MAG: aminoacyl-tRNA hydrolase [Firmicutes bacterium]|nr:aminoacyl-tRNA hydrolase [Bacillota bacterium]